MTATKPPAEVDHHLELEARIAAAVTRGDFESAATAVIRSYGPQVLGYLKAIVKDAEEAEDAFALFAENVWRGLPSWDGRASARAWAYRVAWNAAGRQFRDPWHRRRRELPANVASTEAAAVISSSGRDLDRLQARLEQLRSSMTREEQSLLVLRVDRDLSWREVALAMGETDDATGCAVLRKRFERLKEKLARAARARGLLGDS